MKFEESIPFFILTFEENIVLKDNFRESVAIGAKR